MAPTKDAHPTTQEKMLVEHIKQYPGPVQVTRSVYAMSTCPESTVPGPVAGGADRIL